ncbi:hypothetical protein NL676_023368 [Syzygium grande]|nr:hypothetical protein NL676_023368 [Syzygium grande]
MTPLSRGPPSPASWSRLDLDPHHRARGAGKHPPPEVTAGDRAADQAAAQAPTKTDNRDQQGPDETRRLLPDRSNTKTRFKRNGQSETSCKTTLEPHILNDRVGDVTGRNFVAEPLARSTTSPNKRVNNKQRR